MYFSWLTSHDFQCSDPTLIWPAKPLHVKLVLESGVSFGPFEGVQKTKSPEKEVAGVIPYLT